MERRVPEHPVEILTTPDTQVAEGHELANHLCEDKSCVGMDCETFARALGRCDDLIASLDETWRNRRVKWFRPPQGYMGAFMADPLKALGYRTALADVFPLDTEVRAIDWMADFVMDHAKPGSIVLLHAPDARGNHQRQNNVAVFRKVFPRLKAAFAVGPFRRADMSLMKIAATPRLPRGYSAETTPRLPRGHSAETTPRPRRGRSVETGARLRYALGAPRRQRGRRGLRRGERGGGDGAETGRGGARLMVNFDARDRCAQWTKGEVTMTL